MSKRNRRYDEKRSNNARSNPPGVILELSSGFTIRVRPLAPFYMDVISEAIPMPDYPKRAVTLLAGDVVLVDYEVPAEPPSIDSDDYQLYMRWKYIDGVRKERDVMRKRARKDYLLATCVDILSGPIDIDDPDWVNRLEAAFEGYKVPDHPGKRQLAFLKNFVILSPEWMEVVIKTATAQEVTMQGVFAALQQFQYNSGAG